MKPAFGAILLLFFTFLSACERNKTPVLRTETIRVDSVEQIVLLQDSLVKPILYTQVSGLEKLPRPEAKARFISAILPAILVTKYKIETARSKVAGLRVKEQWDATDSAFYTAIKSRYKAKNLEDLMVRMGTLPNSIVLAQAAVESGWGQSRFFVQASNVFGIWSVNAGESRIAAGKTRQNETIYLRAYEDMSVSIMDYFEVLARSRAYRNLRKARLETNDPFMLLPHLKYYSEQKTSYIKLLKDIIIQNKLTQYDRYQLDPEYLTEE